MYEEDADLDRIVDASVLEADAAPARVLGVCDKAAAVARIFDEEPAAVRILGGNNSALGSFLRALGEDAAAAWTLDAEALVLFSSSLSLRL